MMQRKNKENILKQITNISIILEEAAKAGIRDEVLNRTNAMMKNIIAEITASSPSANTQILYDQLINILQTINNRNLEFLKDMLADLIQMTFIEEHFTSLVLQDFKQIPELKMKPAKTVIKLQLEDKKLHLTFRSPLECKNFFNKLNPDTIDNIFYENKTIGEPWQSDSTLKNPRIHSRDPKTIIFATYLTEETTQEIAVLCQNKLNRDCLINLINLPARTKLYDTALTVQNYKLYKSYNAIINVSEESRLAKLTELHIDRGSELRTAGKSLYLSLFKKSHSTILPDTPPANAQPHFNKSQKTAIHAIIKNIKKVLTQLPDSNKNNNLKEDIENHLNHLFKLSEQIFISAKKNEITNLRKSLAILIVRLDVNDKDFKIDFIDDNCRINKHKTGIHLRLSEVKKDSTLDHQLLKLLKQLMQISFYPNLQLKIPELKDAAYHFNPLVDIASSILEYQNISLKELTFSRFAENKCHFTFEPSKGISEAKKAINIIMKNFEFFMAMFNINHDNFQTWAKMHNLFDPNFKKLHQKLFAAIKADWHDDDIGNGIQEIFLALQEAYKTNNSQTLLQALFKIGPNSDNYARNLAQTLVKHKKTIENLSIAWNKYAEEQFHNKLSNIGKNMIEYFDFYTAIFNTNPSDIDDLDEKVFKSIKALIGYIHEDERSYNLSIDYVKSIYQFNNIRKENLLKAIQQCYEEKNYQPLAKVLCLGKNNFLHIHHKLVDKLNDLANDSEIIFAWNNKREKVSPIKSMRTLNTDLSLLVRQPKGTLFNPTTPQALTVNGISSSLTEKATTQVAKW